MTQYYIGSKQITAWEADGKNGEAGYAVQYSDGYTSWSPKKVFESAYFPMGEASDGSKVTSEMVGEFIAHLSVEKLGKKTTSVTATLANGYEITEVSACVDPANYDEKIGTELAIEKIKSKVWDYLGFLLQTARVGVLAPVDIEN